jgi:hypothetical protein
VRSQILLLIVLSGGCSASDDVPAPMVSSVSPDHAQPGVSIMILGDYFCQQPETDGDVDPLACENMGIVEIGTVPSSTGLYTDQMITAEVPWLGAGSYAVSVSVAGRRSNGVTLVVDSP